MSGVLDRPRQRAVVDERAPDRPEAADLGKHRGLHQDAATSRGGDPPARPVGQVERIEQAEEEDEGGQQQLLPASPHPERRHHRDQSRPRLRLPGEQRPDHPRLERDVGIQQQRQRRLDPLPPLLQGPELAGPALGQRRAGVHVDHERFGHSLPRDLRRAVAGAVVD